MSGKTFFTADTHFNHEFSFEKVCGKVCGFAQSTAKLDKGWQKLGVGN